MELNELTKMIDEYFDGELDKSKEPAFFISLSANDKARNYFKQHHLLKSITDEMMEDFPQELEEQILLKTISIGKRRFFGQKIKSFFAYAAVIIFFLASLFFYNESISYKNDIARINNKIEDQDRTIKRLLNSLPETEIKAKFSNEVIIKAN